MIRTRIAAKIELMSEEPFWVYTSAPADKPVCRLKVYEYLNDQFPEGYEMVDLIITEGIEFEEDVKVWSLGIARKV